MESSNKITYDIIIIGSGPAGIAAALFCLQHHKKTLLIDGDDPTPESNSKKECIESIHPGVLSLLKHLKISTDLSACIRGTFNYISNGQEYKSLNPYDSEIWTGYHINKLVFLDFLKEEAKKQKLEILKTEMVADLIKEGTRITGVKTKSHKNIFAHYTIDASGKNKLFGKKLQLTEKRHSKSLIVWSGISHLPYKLFDNEKSAYFIPKKNSWTWIGRLNDNSYCWTHLSFDKTAISVPQEFTNSTKNEIQKVANMRWRIFRPLCMEGGVICGDAAYVIDPASGQGILNSLSSGIKAGQTAVACINNSDLENIILAEYDSWTYNQFKQKIDQLSIYYKAESMDV